MFCHRNQVLLCGDLENTYHMHRVRTTITTQRPTITTTTTQARRFKVSQHQCVTQFLFLLSGKPCRWLAATTGIRARPAAGENGACARGSNTNGRASQCPWQSTSTTRDQMRARAEEEVEHEPHNALRGQNPLPRGVRPGILAEPRSQRCDRSWWHSSGDTPLLAVAADGVDASTLSFLTAAALAARRRLRGGRSWWRAATAAGVLGQNGGV